MQGLGQKKPSSIIERVSNVVDAFVVWFLKESLFQYLKQSDVINWIRPMKPGNIEWTIKATMTTNCKIDNQLQQSMVKVSMDIYVEFLIKMTNAVEHSITQLR